MSDLQPGDRVDVVIKGVRMGERSPIRMTIEDEHGELWVLPPQAAITRVYPEQWPPFHNDVWRDRANTLWVCGNDGWGPRMYSAIGDMEPDKALREYGLTTLVHREEPPF